MFDEIKKTITPPYNTGDLYSIFIALFIMVTIPLTVLQVTNARDNRSEASIFANPTANINSDIKVRISTPNDTDSVSGAVNVAVDASDEEDTISQIIIISGGKTLATINNSSSSSKFTASFSWDTTKERNGSTILSATAVNSLGQKNNSSTINLTLANIDTTSPQVSFNQPNEGAYLSGTNYFVKINADDNLGLGFVELSLDNKVVKKFFKAPYELRLDLTSVAPGNHLLSARAVDLSANATISSVKVYRGVKAIDN